MKGTFREFITGAFGLIALFLILARSGGFARAVGASTTGASGIFKTLQGR